MCDIYDGSSLSVTGFFSTIPKIALIAFSLKLVFCLSFDHENSIDSVFVLSGVGSICFAAIAALYQKRIKRLFAYSTISHSGFLCLAIGCLDYNAAAASIIYVFIYALTNLNVFSVLFLSGLNSSQQLFIVN